MECIKKRHLCNIGLGQNILVSRVLMEVHNVDFDQLQTRNYEQKTKKVMGSHNNRG